MNSLIFVNGLQPPPSGFPKNALSSGTQTTHNFEGLWWKQENNVSGFVALANITEQPINDTLRLTDSNDAQLESDQVTISPHATKMVNFTQLKLTSSVSGGVYLTHDGIEHGLVINGGLEDQSVGYSAHLPLVPSPQDPAAGTSTTASNFSFAELGPATFPTPPFPDYVSGHSTYSAAAARILTLWTGSAHFGDSVTMARGSSKIEPGVSPAQPVTLKWETFEEAANEEGMSRRYGGIHFARADLAGRQLGRLVAEKSMAEGRKLLRWDGKDEATRASFDGQWHFSTIDDNCACCPSLNSEAVRPEEKAALA